MELAGGDEGGGDKVFILGMSWRDVIETFRQFWRQEEGFLKEVKTCFLGKEERANQFLSPIHT